MRLDALRQSATLPFRPIALINNHHPCVTGDVAQLLHAKESGGLVEVLLFTAGDHVCGLPLHDVIETMRPRDVESVAALPEFVLGTCVIRQQPTPVVNIARLLGVSVSQVTRFVSLRVGNRQVALAVDAVLGIHNVDEQRFAHAPPLTGGQSASVSALAVLDDKLLHLLSAARLLPHEVLAECPELPTLSAQGSCE